MKNGKLQIQFPMDLVVEILARLPVKSLMRFKCVCKFFNDLIKSDNQFKHKHYGISKAKSDCVLLEMGSDVREYYLLYNESESKEIGSIYLDIPRSWPIRWVKCFQGMLCMISPKIPDGTKLDGVDYLIYDILIWNPSIKKVKALPSITFPNKLPKDAFVATEFGFGISNNMTLKIVMLLEIRDRYGGTRNVRQITMVYSQACGDSWSLRQINSVPSCPPFQGHGSDFYLKGRYYWLAKSYYNQPFTAEQLLFDPNFDLDYLLTYKKNFKQLLVWFDMDDEVFGTIELLSDVDTISVTIMNETIAVLGCPSEGDHNCIEIWLMIENDNNIYWRKQACVLDIENNGCVRPIGIWNVDCQLLVLPDGIIRWDGFERDIPYFLSIDLVTHERKKFYISKERKSINIASNPDGYFQVYNERNIDIIEEWKRNMFSLHLIYARVYTESLYLL